MKKALKFIRNLLYVYAIDKQLHFTWSYILGVYGFIIIYFIPVIRNTLRPYEIAIIVVAIVAMFNLFKELLDDVEQADGTRIKKSIDFNDIGVGCLGVITAVVTLLLILK